MMMTIRGHRRTGSIDHTNCHSRGSSSDISNFSLSSLNSTVTPPESPKSMKKTSKHHGALSHKTHIDLDLVTKHSSEYKKRLSSSQAQPAISSIREFPECNVYDTSEDEELTEKMLLGDILRSKTSPFLKDRTNSSLVSTSTSDCELPDSSTNLIQRYEKTNDNKRPRVFRITSFKK